MTPMTLALALALATMGELQAGCPWPCKHGREAAAAQARVFCKDAPPCAHRAPACDHRRVRTGRMPRRCATACSRRAAIEKDTP